jgi:glutamate carboxypeptidase
MEALAARAQAMYGELGLKLTMEGSGAADANFASGVGAAALDGSGREAARFAPKTTTWS